MTRLFLVVALCLGIICTIQKASAQPQPVLSCVSVSTDGSSTIEVSWEIPSGAFDGFRLIYGLPGGPYDSVNFPNTANSANISVSDPTTNKYEFFLRTFINSPNLVSKESNHLQTILLIISGSGTGVAKLEWNHQGGNEMEYRVLQSFDNLFFTLLTTTTNLEYFDTISQICNPVTKYYIIEHGICGAKSNFVSALLEDLTPPKDPDLKLVTIENGFAQLSWDPSPSADADSIIIEREIGGWYEYHTIAKAGTFIDNLTSNSAFISACDQVVTYMVRTKDLCGLESSGAINYTFPHNTILLTGNTEELCDRKATLYWNAYNNMEPPVSHYKVERSVTGGPFIDISDVPAAGSSFSFVDPELLEPGNEVKYRITAVNSDNSLLSHSCELTLIPNPEVITDFRTNFITVSNNSFITLNVECAPPQIPVLAEIYKNSGDEMQLISTMTWNQSGILSFEDHDVQVDKNSYSYTVRALDSCGNMIAESQLFNSILLQIDVQNETDVSLLWNELIGWDSELKEYQIFKYNDGILVAGYPKVISPGITEYNETDESDALKTTYVVKAVNYDETTVLSNEVLLPRVAKIDTPTAFRPHGYNKIFRPLLKNVDSGSYQLTIYNRWGQIVFETNNIDQGWNGEVNGNLQPGVYVFMVSYKDQTGNNGVKRGTVTLID